MSSRPSEPKQNRLAHESSPYLRQHADNPVDWYPWGDEALARARELKRPILLSVGYSACHWCHVMAHESFEDPKTAELMNALFINIKVDREERPDVDQLYQGVVQLMGRGGGWPLTVFLTPDLRPFYGGTYFPKEDRYGMPAFSKVLHSLHEAYVQKPADIEEQANQFRQGLLELTRQGLKGKGESLQVSDVLTAGAELTAGVDGVHGGFGGAPKFPNPMNVALLLRASRRGAPEATRAAAFLTLEKMATGGIYDQLGGGFHRYSVDASWTVPHFEKMLYDNAQLLHLYSEAHQVEPRPLWKKTVTETVAYVEREMTSPGGGFYATQDADSEGEEGKFFSWTPAQIREVLGAAAAKPVLTYFGVTDEGNFEHGASVLEVRSFAESLEPALRTSLQALWTAREKRIKPGRDEKILAGWNGMMIRALALASRVFGKPEWAGLAARAADFVLAKLWDGSRLQRVHQDGVSKIDGFLEDYGGLAAGLTALYQATFEVKYLVAAEALVTAAMERFWDAAENAYWTAPRGQKDLLHPPYALHDNAVPSGASMLTEAQVALAALTGEAAHLEQANRYVEKLASEMKRNPFAFGHLWLAADALLDGAAEVTLVGPGPKLEPWVRSFNASYQPTVCLRVRGAGVELGLALQELTKDRLEVPGRAVAYFCHHFACRPPVESWEALSEQLLNCD